VRLEGVDALKNAVDIAYPRSHPEYSNKYTVHTCKVVEGVKVYDGLLV
jgi:hypothetical protein